MNDGKFAPAPLPFKVDRAGQPTGELNPEYQNEVRSSLARQTGIRGHGRTDTSFNPFDPETNQLVTHITSGYSQGNVEGYARWYEPAAKQLGYVEKKWDKKTGKEAARRQWLIPAHYVHKNVISVNDPNHLQAIGAKVKELQSQGLTYDEIKAGLLADPMIYHATHQGHHDPASTHGRIGRKAGEAQMIREVPPGGQEDQIMGVAYCSSRQESSNRKIHLRSGRILKSIAYWADFTGSASTSWMDTRGDQDGLRPSKTDEG